MKTHEEHRFCQDNPGRSRHRGPKRLVLVVLLFLSLGLFSSARGDLISGCPVVAHRGYSYIAPENSMAAIYEAINVGAHGSEFDVYRCATGEIVLMHDATIDAATNGTGPVTELPWSYLQTVVVDDPPLSLTYGTQYIPLMSQALGALKDSGTAAVCEIKQSGIASDVVAGITAAGMLGQTAVISFNFGEIAMVEAINPSIVTGLLMGSVTGGTVEQKADWIQAQLTATGADLADVAQSQLSESLMVELNARGIPVWAWTVNNQPTMQALFDLGVKSITTDRPDLALEIVPEPSLLAMSAGLAVLFLALARRRSRPAV